MPYRNLLKFIERNVDRNVQDLYRLHVAYFILKFCLIRPVSELQTINFNKTKKLQRNSRFRFIQKFLNQLFVYAITILIVKICVHLLLSR